MPSVWSQKCLNQSAIEPISGAGGQLRWHRDGPCGQAGRRGASCGAASDCGRTIKAQVRGCFSERPESKQLIPHSTACLRLVGAWLAGLRRPGWRCCAYLHPPVLIHKVVGALHCKWDGKRVAATYAAGDGTSHEELGRAPDGGAQWRALARPFGVATLPGQGCRSLRTRSLSLQTQQVHQAGASAQAIGGFTRQLAQASGSMRLAGGAPSLCTMLRLCR